MRKAKGGLRPATPEAYALLHEGSLALAELERVGIKMDVGHLERAIKEVQEHIAQKEAELRTGEAYRVWARHFGNGMSLQAPGQLGHIVFNVMGCKRNPFLYDREAEKDRNSEAAFEHLSLPWLKDHFEVRKLKKALKTNLLGLKGQMVDGYVHPFYDVHTVETYRSSSSAPNLQNLPVRNKKISEIIRSCVVFERGHVGLEADYSTQEVRVAYCYCKDDRLRHDILTGDMHRDRAKEIYLLTDGEMGPSSDKKDPGALPRYAAKNKFVFPQFYGSVYSQCAPNLWDAISQLDMTTADGTSLYDHLRGKGLESLGACDWEQAPKPGTFEAHVQEVERHMWEDVLTVYHQWKIDWWDLYLRQGGVNFLTGFRMEGAFRRNQVLCACVQGAAFHCLLWSIIQLQKEMKRKKMRSRMVCEVHDSMLFSAHRREVDDLRELVEKVAVRRVARHWPWITIPLKAEFELCEGSWANKRKME